MNTLLSLWRILDGRERRRFIGLQLLGLLMAFSTFLGIASIAPFLLVLSEPRAFAHYAPLMHMRELLAPASDREFTLMLGAGFVCVFTLTNAINLLGTLAMQRFSLRVGDRMHAALLAEYLYRDYRFHARIGPENLFNRVVFWVNRITFGVLDSVLLLSGNAMVLLVIFTSVVWLDPRLALGVLVWLGGGYLLLYSALRRRLVRHGMEEAEFIEARTRLATEGLFGIKEVLLLGKQAHFIDTFARSCHGISRHVSRTQAFTLSPRYALEALTVIGLVGITMVVSAGGAAAGWIAQMTFLGFAAYRLLPAVQQIFSSVVRVRTNRVYLEDVLSDLAGTNARAPHDAVEVKTPRLAPRDAIELDAISYRYAPEAPPAIRDVSLRIAAGAMIGFAGPNGCGKTTLLDLIAGLLEPDSGRVLVDGVALDAARRAAWWREISYVPQQPYLFEATLAENIAFGAADGRVDRARVNEVAGLARLDGLVAGFPRGLDERIGGGARRLSGGERQRIALARALYRDAPVLLLDESTSALDGLAEREILEMFQALRGSRTLLLVAHRLQTLRACDRIFELEAGAIVRRGDFVALAQSSPAFHLVGMR